MTQNVGKSVLKRIVSGIIGIVVTFSPVMPEIIASASNLGAEAYNRDVKTYAKEIGDRYNINVEYSVRNDGYAVVGMPSLATLDQTLGYLSKEFVVQLSDYYAKGYASRLTFYFTSLPEEKEANSEYILGNFDSKTSTMNLYVPSASKNMVMSGCSPFTILHEVGHAYSLALFNTIGYDVVKTEWLKFNGRLPYGQYSGKNLDKKVFPSVYAASGFEEDFADTFAYAFGCNRGGLGLSDRLYNSNGRYSGFGMKINYLENVISKMFKNSTTILAGISQSCSAPVHKYYGNLTLSGNSLEYIGFNQPYGVLDNNLAALKISAVRTSWQYEVGGWKVWDTSGGIYVVFPGAEFATIKIPSK